MSKISDVVPNMEKERKYDLEGRLLRFAVEITKVVEGLPDSKVCNHFGGQLLRSGTSPALNYAEAQAAGSRKDFIHKLRIILKELRETSVCMEILKERDLLPESILNGENRQLIAIFTKSIITAKETQ